MLSFMELTARTLPGVDRFHSRLLMIFKPGVLSMGLVGGDKIRFVPPVQRVKTHAPVRASTLKRSYA